MDTQSWSRRLIAAADLGAASFHLDDTREIFGDILRYKLNISKCAIPVVRGGSGKRFHNLSLAECKWPEWVPKVMSALFEKGALAESGLPLKTAIQMLH